jgi:hypothetical protein
MKKISGYVLVKETNAAVPNLVVAAYDSDKPLELKGKHIIPAQVREFGRRIGSVLTDQDGQFVLTSEDLEFQGNESRPDLALIVFAPEDILRLDEPYPLPPEERILYVSTIPRTEAGAEEAFIIRLLRAQLEKFHISSGTSGQTSRADSTGLASAVEAGWSFRDSFKEKLRPRLQAKQAKSEEIRRIAHEKTQNLSAVPLHLRDDDQGTNPLRNNRLLIKDRNELSKNLASFQEASINEGLERLQTYRPTLRLRLTRSDLLDLGLDEASGHLTGELDSEKLADKIRSLMQGVDFVRVRGLNNPSPDELERKYLSEET